MDAASVGVAIHKKIKRGIGANENLTKDINICTFKLLYFADKNVHFHGRLLVVELIGTCVCLVKGYSEIHFVSQQKRNHNIYGAGLDRRSKVFQPI